MELKWKESEEVRRETSAGVPHEVSDEESFLSFEIPKAKDGVLGTAAGVSRVERKYIPEWHQKARYGLP